MQGHEPNADQATLIHKAMTSASISLWNAPLDRTFVLWELVHHCVARNEEPYRHSQLLHGRRGPPHPSTNPSITATIIRI